MSKHFVKLAVLSLAALALVGPGTAKAQQQGMQIVFDSLKIGDEDDPASNDEPYLIVTKFQMRVRLDARGSVTVVPNTLSVSAMTGGHNNLGRRSDNWADEPNTYQIPQGVRRVVQNLFPLGEDGWILGAVVVFMEEDAFTPSTAGRLTQAVHSTVRQNLQGMSFTATDSRTVSDAVARKITQDLGRSLKRLNVGGIIRGLASAVDPDDFGGAQVIVLANARGNEALAFAGLPPADAASALAGTQRISGATRMSLNFPAGDLRSVPGNARYQGKCRVNFTVKAWTQSELY